MKTSSYLWGGFLFEFNNLFRFREMSAFHESEKKNPMEILNLIMIRYSSLLLFLFIVACGSNTTTVVEKETIPNRPKPTKPLPPAAPVSDSQAIDAAWVACWTRFQEGMEKDSRPLMLSIINFPVTGANLVCDDIYNATSDAMEFGNNMFTIFDATVKREVLKKSPSDVSSYTLSGNAYKNSPAPSYNLPEGTTIYKFTVRRITKTSSGTSPVLAENYHFAKFNGSYKLAWIDQEKL